MSFCVYGINASREAIRSGSAKKVLCSRQAGHSEVVAEAQKLGLPIETVSEAELQRLSKGGKTQGILVETNPIETHALRDLIAEAKAKPGNRYPLFLMLDGIQDPHNLGAVLRCCDAFSVDGVILKSKGEVPLNETVARVSTGAIHYVKVAVVDSLNQAISELKDAGYLVLGAEGSATKHLPDFDLKRPVCLLIGSEGFGIAKKVYESCDDGIRIEMTGHVNSLNASVSAGIVLALTRSLQ